MDLERGVVRDLASLAGMAPTTGGVLTSGGSMANLLCLAPPAPGSCARTAPPTAPPTTRLTRA